MSDMHAELETLIDRISADLTDQALYLGMERGAWPAALWDALAQAGVPRACVPADQGGAELPFADAMVALRRSASCWLRLSVLLVALVAPAAVGGVAVACCAEPSAT